MRALSEHSTLTQIESKLAVIFPDRNHEELRQALHDAIRRAKAFGFGDEEFLPYAAFELVFGSGFVEDPGFPWAREILANNSLTSSMKMQQLREAGIFHLAREVEESEWAEQHQQDDDGGDNEDARDDEDAGESADAT